MGCRKDQFSGRLRWVHHDDAWKSVYSMYVASVDVENNTNNYIKDTRFIDKDKT